MRRDPNRPKVPELVALIEALYRVSASGCCCHVMFDDDNYDCATFCLERAREREAEEPDRHRACVAAAELATRMTKTQIATATKRARRC